MRSPSPYRWRCKICDVSNDPAAMHCDSCGYRSPYLASLEKKGTAPSAAISWAWSFFARRWSRK